MNTNTCIVLGEGALPIKCIELLQANDFELLALISRDLDLSKEAERLNIPFYTSPQEMRAIEAVSYIFSINNGIILKPDFIAKASKLVVNYHDSPLPKYAGMYAPNWALINGEQQHAISWHVLDGGIDTGDILEQLTIDIEPNETIWSVNMKCFEAAIQCFEQLIGKLKSNTVVRKPQNADRRSYFPLMKRPHGLGFVTAELSTEDLKRLLAATSYGHQGDNEFLLPRLLIGNDCYSMPNFQVVTAEVTVPGQLVDVEQGYGFYCTDGLVIPSTLYDKHNAPLAFETLVRTMGWKAGTLLPPPANADLLTKAFETTCKGEFYWKQQTERREILPFPFVRSQHAKGERYTESYDFTIPEALRIVATEEVANYLSIAVVGLGMLRLADRNQGSIGLIPPSLPQRILGAESLLQSVLPLNMSCPDTNSVRKLLLLLLAQIKKMDAMGSHTIDLSLRYKSLVDSAAECYGIVICQQMPPTPCPETLYLILQDEKLALSLPNATYANFGRSLADALAFFAENMAKNLENKLFEFTIAGSRTMDYWKNRVNVPSGSAVELVSILDSFRQQAINQPTKLAIVEDSQAHTYETFLYDVQNVATLLQQKGVKPGNAVLICLPRSYRFLVVQWAVLQCRAAFVPIDSSMPDDRKRFIFEDSGSVLVATDSNSAEVFPVEAVFSMDEMPSSVDSIDFSYQPTLPTDTAYIIYTSGSTGVPKGVRISHQALQTFISGALGTYGIDSSDRVLQFSNLGFDASIEEVFCTLCAGGTLHLRNEEMLDPEVLVEYSIAQGITVWDFPTAFWRQVILATQDRSFPESLRTVLIGGEAITNSDFEVWKKHPSSKCRLFNTYGPTETTVVATVFEVTTDFQLERTIPIGHPLPNYEVMVLDSRRNPVPMGFAGELCIAGPALADGYLNRPEVQEKAFIHIETPTGSKRCYATGDLVFGDSEGCIQYIGRGDNQLKIRGYRVEPGEIENQIMGLGGLRQCVVLGKVNEKGEKSLVAFFVPLDARVGAAEALRLETLALLPSYMVPDYFVEVKEIPMTPNGKIDKKYLLTLATPPKRAPKTPKVAASNQQLSPTVEKLTAVWRMVLEDDTITAFDNFFDNGGHSLRAVRLMTEIKKQLGKQLPLSALISCPTPNEFAKLIDSEQTETLWQCLVPIRKTGTKMPLYLIHGAGLNVLLYQSMGNYLDSDRPIYALQAKGLDGNSKLSESIEEMASDYIREIRQKQPDGPYAILGFSLGGFIAFEMGRQLQEQNQKVAFLGVIDTVTTFANENLPLGRKLFEKIKDFIGKPLYFVYVFFRESGSDRSKFLKQKAKNVRGMLFYYASRMGLYKPDSKPQKGENDTPVYLSSKASVVVDTALYKYILKPASLKVDLYRAEKQLFYIPEPKTYGWNRYALDGVNVVNVPGEHSAIFAPPNDKLFANLLNKRLDEIEKTF